MYVDALIGKDTVNTIPVDTYNELRDNGAGHAHSTLDQGMDDATRTLAHLGQAGIDMAKVTDDLLVDGVKQFDKAFDGLLKAVADKKAKLAHNK